MGVNGNKTQWRTMGFLGGVIFVVISVFLSCQSTEEKYIAVISKGFQHEFWQAVKQGSDGAATELGVHATFEGPSDESMIGTQVSMVENAIAKKVDGILLAALDQEALVPVIQKVNEVGIPIVMFESDVNSSIPISCVATDNKVAGKIAAENLGRLLNGEGIIGIMAHSAETSIAQERRDGFIEGIQNMYPNISLLDPVYSDSNRQSVANKTIDMIRTNGNLSAIFATNENATIGVASGVVSEGAEGKVLVVGVDSTDVQVDYLKKKVVQGLVVQNPYQMGYQGVQTLVKAINGESVKERIDTGTVWVDLQNFYDPSVQELIYPLQ